MFKTQDWLITKWLNIHLYMLEATGIMTNKGSITLIGAVLLATALLTGAATAFFSKSPDSPVEQAAESYLKHQIGLDIDFSKEKKEGSDK
jgi:hypothetical protein